MQYIAVHINLFSLKQPIYLIKDNEPMLIGAVSINDIDSAAAGLCKKYNAQNIKLFGEEKYIKKIGKKIINFAKQNYSIENLIVEVNDEILN